MPQIVECVPNFSDGRRPEVVEAIAAAITAAGGRVLDIHSDPDHNRSVITFLADLARVETAALAGVAAAAERIDMTAHRGAHPRIGAADVVPFIPLRDVSMAECIALAQRVGQRIAADLGLPVYLYARAATQEDRRELSAIRRGEYEGLAKEIGTNPERAPDYGPSAMGPAGAVAVGARPPLIAFNAYLSTRDVEVADAVARCVRESSGGLKHVQARGFAIPHRKAAQVSMNLLRHDRTPLPRVLELVRREAARHGLAVTSTELVGLAPRAAMTDAAGWYLQLENFGPDRIVETYLAPEPRKAAVPLPEDFVDAVASDSPTPGGGSVAAVVGGMGAALAAMVAGLTVGRKRYASVEDDMRQLRSQAFGLQGELMDLATADMAAFESVMAAYRLPKDTPEGAGKRQEAIQDGLRKATEVPLDTMRRAVDVLEIARRAAEIGNTNAISDAGIAARMAHAACRGASFNVAINVRSLRDLAEGDGYRREAMDLAQEADRLVEECERIVRSRIAI